MTPRAPSLPPDERRRAIVAALIPLLAERGAEVSTKEIADAAGIAEGTIFRVFPDKRSLMLAAAEEAINPADGDQVFHDAIDGLRTLREKVTVAVERTQERMKLTLPVMIALRRHAMTEGPTHADRPPGPPEFVFRSEAALLERLEAVFETHRDELAVEPQVAATALRSLVLGSGPFGRPVARPLSPTDIADVLLDGLLTREG